MNEELTNIKAVKIVKLVRLAIVFKSPIKRNKEAATVIHIIANQGESVRFETLEKILGMAFSSAMPNTNLDPHSNIIKAVLNVENNAITDSMTKLWSPNTC